MAPVEPNVPRQIVEGYTELGNWMAKELRNQGFKGNHDQFNLRCLDAGARLFPLSRWRAHSFGNCIGAHCVAYHGEV